MPFTSRAEAQGTSKPAHSDPHITISTGKTQHPKGSCGRSLQPSAKRPTVTHHFFDVTRIDIGSPENTRLCLGLLCLPRLVCLCFITLAAMGKFKDAERSYRKAIALSPSKLSVRLHLGDCLMHRGQTLKGLREQLKGSGALNFNLKKGLSVRQW